MHTTMIFIAFLAYMYSSSIGLFLTYIYVYIYMYVYFSVEQSATMPKGEPRLWDGDMGGAKFGVEEPTTRDCTFPKGDSPKGINRDH